MLTAAADGLLEGSLTCAGIALADAEAFADIFAAAIADVYGVHPDRVTVTFSSGRRRLQSGSDVDVYYEVRYETEEKAEAAIMVPKTGFDFNRAMAAAAALEGGPVEFIGMTVVDVSEPVARPAVVARTPAPTAAPTTTPGGSGGGGGGGGEDSGVTIIIIVVVIVIIVFAGVGACIGFMRASPKDNGTKVAPADAGAAAALTATETANEAALAQHQDVAEVVATGMGLVNSLLTAGSLVPFVGNIAEVANEFFGSASEFADKADDVVTAARRVVEVLELVTLMNN